PRLLDLVLPAALPTPHDLARLWFRRGWMALIERLIAERPAAAPNAAPRDLFDLLVAARDPETGAAFPPRQLRDQAATMILAGHETTASALFWALHLLALAPDAQDRVAEEAARSGLELEAPEPSIVDRLVYARAVI